MITKYVIHRTGTPKFAWKNHWTEFASEYWNNKNGWGFKWESEVFDNTDYNLPEEGEWVEIYVNESI